MDKRCLIEVTEYRAIGSDRDNWMLLKRTKKTDKETGKPIGGYSDWISYKYYATFEQAARALEDQLIRMCGATTFPELRRSAKQIHEQLLEVLDVAKMQP